MKMKLPVELRGLDEADGPVSTGGENQTKPYPYHETYLAFR